MSLNLNALMKQAQEMQKRMQDVQRDIATLEVSGLSGAGLVEVIMTGQYTAKRVKIDSSLLTEEKEVLEDLITAAINDAVRKVEEGTRGKMSSLTAGMDLPKDFKLPSDMEGIE